MLMKDIGSCNTNNNSNKSNPRKKKKRISPIPIDPYYLATTNTTTTSHSTTRRRRQRQRQRLCSSNTTTGIIKLIIMASGIIASGITTMMGRSNNRSVLFFASSFQPPYSHPLFRSLSGKPWYAPVASKQTATTGKTKKGTYYNKQRSKLKSSSNSNNNKGNKKVASKVRPHDKETGERLFRADRVLANRTGKTRKECFELLKFKQVYTTRDGSRDKDPAASNDDDENADNKNSNKLKIGGPKDKILMNTPLWIDRQGKVPDAPPKLLVYHKPKWVLSTIARESDPRPSIGTLVAKYSGNVHPVGRLDYDTSGLLLLSSDGKITQSILHPKFHIEKEYVATVVGKDLHGQKARREFIQTLAEGVPLVDILEKKKKRKSQQQSQEQSLQQEQPQETTESTAKFFNATCEVVEITHIPLTNTVTNVHEYIDNIVSELPPEYDRDNLKQRGYMKLFEEAKTRGMIRIRLIVTEGKYRMVRRMLANAGYPVISLQRIRIGPIRLMPEEEENGDDDSDASSEVRVGSVRELFPEERKWIYNTLLKKS